MTASADSPGGAREPEDRAAAARAAADGRSTASQRHADLVRSAADLFARNGVQATTVREIAREAGILSGSLYHHFDSKESIVDEVLAPCAEDLLRTHRVAASRDETPRQVLSTLIGACCSVLAEHRAALAIVHNDWNHLRRQRRFDYLAAAEREMRALWVRTIEDGQTDGLLRGGVEPPLAYRMMRDALLGAARWYRPDGPLTPSALADRYVLMFMDGLSTRPRQAARPFPDAAGGSA